LQGGGGICANTKQQGGEVRGVSVFPSGGWQMELFALGCRGLGKVGGIREQGPVVMNRSGGNWNGEKGQKTVFLIRYGGAFYGLHGNREKKYQRRKGSSNSRLGWRKIVEK